ncbi:MAG: D-alanyl-D-alanine carboxypeptidase [Clostridia bacterium]|nr:D-alanyl-D-alanine carboxypeptidase [Clostridia bacterium]
MFKRLLCLVLAGIFLCCLPWNSFASETPAGAVGGSVAASGELNLDAKGAILMEAETGTVLYEANSKDRLYPASVTKVMTMLLVMEALDSGTITEDDPVTASENACSYGGTQIYLEVGESMTLRDLLKAVAVNSANDAAVALGEYLAGSEAAFVTKMNERAVELGAENTNFVNPCGLPDDNHYTCAYDVALFTRELLKHPHILDYTGIWMDSLRNGGFGLANTNKLLKTYDGITGMKTGYTEAAGHCLSATATRDGMSLIAVVLGGETSKGRFASAAALLDYGFGGYTVVRRSVGNLAEIPVLRGKSDAVSVEAEGNLCVVVKKSKVTQISLEITVEESLQAPVSVGQVVGFARYLYEGEEILSVPVVATEEVKKAGFFDYFGQFIDRLFS